MYREIIIPTEQDCVIHLPYELVGKKVEIIAFEQVEKNPLKPMPKNRLTNEQFLAMAGILKDSSLTVESIKARAWRKTPIW
jgi:hypothetical protein